MYFYTVRELLPALAILGATFLLLGSVALAFFVLWKVVRQLVLISFSLLSRTEATGRTSPSPNRAI